MICDLKKIKKMIGNFKIHLKPDCIKQIPFHKYINDFSFIVNGEEIKTNRVISDLISPKISQIHFSDPTIDSYTFDTVNKGDFSHILNLATFETLQYPTDELPFLTEVLKLLGNDMIDILDVNEEDELTTNNVIQQLLLHQNPEFNCFNSIERETDFASENFKELCESHQEELENLDLMTLSNILTNPKLVIKDEDQLLHFVNFLYSKDNRKLTLYESVIFANTSSEAMKEFVDLIDMNDITNSMWIELSRRLKEDVVGGPKQREKSDSSESDLYGQRYGKKQVHGTAFLKEEGQNFQGVINHLQKVSNGKIDNLMNFTSSSVENDYYCPKNVSLFGSKYNYFHSKDLENSWICLDFKDHKVCPTDYEIRSYSYNANDQHPKSWVIEVSNDLETWIKIDEENDCSYLNGRSVSHTFKMKIETLFAFRYLRMRLTGPNWLGKNSLAIDSFEVYGIYV